MVNSCVFHDFRPLEYMPAKAKTHPPKVGQGLSQGSHTERPFRSWPSAWPGRCGWGGGYRGPEIHQKSKSAPCCWAGEGGSQQVELQPSL